MIRGTEAPEDEFVNKAVSPGPVASVVRVVGDPIYMEVLPGVELIKEGLKLVVVGVVVIDTPLLVAGVVVEVRTV